MMVQGQSVPQVSFFQDNRLYYNPAFAGLADGVEIEGGMRWQWAGLSGGPATQILGAQLKIPTISTGVGLHILNDLAGAGRNTGVSLSLRKAVINKNWKLSLGVQVGIWQNYLDGSRLITPDGNYEGIIDHQDNLVGSDNYRSLSPDLGFGLSVKTEKDWLIGFSVLNLLNRYLKYGGSLVAKESSRDFVLSGQKKIAAGYNVAIIPALICKSDMINIQAELQTAIVYREFMQLQMGFRGYSKRSLDSGIVGAGCQLKNNIFFGYIFDFGVSKLRDNHFGSHELVFRARLGEILMPQKEKIIFNPRFL